ncbi:MAG: hypothetical protein HYX77_06045 [Acidobacteria bacterium]|nr:hypothetical protein [Acidobacteriota bacterium]
MSLVGLFKAFDAVMALREGAKRFSALSTPPEQTLQTDPAAVQEPAGQLETRLTNVVIAALKEAFDRDHARLELERAQLDEERRRAEATLGLELRRQAADRELARLRLLAGVSMAGWIFSVVMFAAGLASGSTPARAALAAGWMLLLGALGAAFTAQRRVGASMPDSARDLDTGPAGMALWLLITGLAATAVSLLL